jgi:transposase-like protein
VLLLKIKGVWHFLYRAVDRAGRTVDFRLSARRDVAAAKAFFRKALKSQQRPPQTITLDGYAASHRAVREPKADGTLPTVASACSWRNFAGDLERNTRNLKAARRIQYACPRAAGLHHNPSRSSSLPIADFSRSGTSIAAGRHRLHHSPLP